MVVLSLLFLVGFISLFEFIYVFPLLARFENTTLNTMKNALLLSIKNLPWTVVLILLTVLPPLAGYMFLQIGVPFFLLMGFSVISLACSHIFRRIYDTDM